MSEVTKRQVPGDVFFEGLSEINEGALLEALDTKMTALFPPCWQPEIMDP